jgi:hypothetical protein
MFFRDANYQQPGATTVYFFYLDAHSPAKEDQVAAKALGALVLINSS